MADLNRATGVTEEIVATVEDMFEYHGWSVEMVDRGKHVRQALMRAVLTILENVPPSPDRSTAIRKLREARMDCDSAITHNGKY